MYKITIRTKSGGVALYEASEEVFQFFKCWLTGGEGTAENHSSVFFFQNGAVHRDNIDIVSWKQASSTETQVQQRFEIVDTIDTTKW